MTDLVTMPAPSISSLRLFTIVARTRSFSEAAHEAGQSQPALSRTIRVLEEELSQRLFDRTTRTVSLTPAGEALFPIAHRLTEEYNAAFCELQQVLSGERGRVSLGVLPAFARFRLPAVLEAFERTHPGVDVVIHDGVSDMLFSRLLNRGIDLAVTTPPPLPDDRIVFDELYVDPYVLVCAEDHQLAGELSLNWSVFANYPFVAMAPGSSVRLLTDAAFAKAALSVRPLFECWQIGTVGALVAQGLGISAIAHSTLDMVAPHRVAWKPLHEPSLMRGVGVATLRQRSLSPAAEALLAILKNNE